MVTVRVIPPWVLPMLTLERRRHRRPANLRCGCKRSLFLLTVLLGRQDAEYPRLLDRCREVELDLDGCIDRRDAAVLGEICPEILCLPDALGILFNAACGLERYAMAKPARDPRAPRDSEPRAPPDR
jgi:hypothetical protein